MDLNQLAHEVLDLTRPRWHNEALLRQIRIDTGLDLGAIQPVAGELAPLREVLMNLVLNAIDAMPGGGRLGVRTWADGQGVHCDVSDSGAGMPAAPPAPWRNPKVLTSASSGLLLAAGWLIGLFGAPEAIPIGFYVAAILVGGYFFGREALEELVFEREIGKRYIHPSDGDLRFFNFIDIAERFIDIDGQIAVDHQSAARHVDAECAIGNLTGISIAADGQGDGIAVLDIPAHRAGDGNVLVGFCSIDDVV